jgi:hypothetical protein
VPHPFHSFIVKWVGNHEPLVFALAFIILTLTVNRSILKRLSHLSDRGAAKGVEGPAVVFLPQLPSIPFGMLFWAVPPSLYVDTAQACKTGCTISLQNDIFKPLKTDN